jgi:hypothetical protein
LEEDRVVQKDVGQSTARAWNSSFHETSAKNGINIDEAFVDLAKRAFANKKPVVKQSKWCPLL